MAESNATQVILTDDGIKIIKAQNTADNAAGGVANLNDPNLMSVIEKQYNTTQFAGLTSQYNVLVQNAKDDGIDTTAVTTAYNNLNQFMSDILVDPDHASDVDRVAYKKYQDAYNEELAKLQNALQNSANNKFTSAASATSQAASTANAAKSAADSTYAYANSEISAQSNATAKAQSTADSAFSQAKTAIDTGQAANQAVTDLKDGSTLTIAELGSGLAEKVSNSEYASYKINTASQISQMVTNGAFSAYQQTTSSLISEKVSNSAFSSYKDETASAIDSKVASSAFATYKDQTANAISSKVDNGDFTTYKTQTANDINLRVTKKGLFDEINLQAGNTLISSSGQLTLSGKNIYFDTVNPVIIPSANIDTLLVNKKLTAANISANTFSTNNETFTVESNGAITAKNMTLTGGTLTSPTINSSTINGGTLNMQTDGLINSPYNGIVQTADQFYHPWKLNTGQLTIGQGYITSVSSGTRSINGVPKQFNSLQGTLSASYLKFTNDFGSRNYIDADMLTCSSPTNNGTMVAINATGNIGINAGDPGAPALTISSGHIDASSSSSYGVFGAITLGYHAHTINSDESLFFESGHGSGNPGINIWAKGFQSLSSRLSTKHQVRLLDDEHSNSLLLGADTATFKYNQDTNADNPNEGVIIDDVNTVKQYNLPDELITRDGKAPTDLMSFIARIISQNKYQARLIENLQIRLRKVEINNE
ncbi:phage tail protein [Lactiplantibacillus plantarum]|nr:phage tail protein [Lactiplantibacillus plantarum]MCG0863320.1 phage tail protein [Lactiplantibacillus plantarum]